jgi:chromosome segregation ATPase
MSIPVVIEAALKRLASALDHLDAASERASKAGSARDDAQEEFALLRDDRSKLALELDGAMAKVKRMERAHDEATRRIDRASEAIQAALGDASEDVEPMDEDPPAPEAG